MKEAYWESHYICSNCGESSIEMSSECPFCKAHMRNTKNISRMHDVDDLYYDAEHPNIKIPFRLSELVRRMIPASDITILPYCGAPYDNATYSDGVICDCGAIVVFKNRNRKESVSVVCPRCGTRIDYA